MLARCWWTTASGAEPEPLLAAAGIWGGNVPCTVPEFYSTNHPPGLSHSSSTCQYLRIHSQYKISKQPCYCYYGHSLLHHQCSFLNPRPNQVAGDLSHLQVYRFLLVRTTESMFPETGCVPPAGSVPTTCWGRHISNKKKRDLLFFFSRQRLLHILY
jgi:hypothetical protein